jgi:hypothetical protein
MKAHKDFSRKPMSAIPMIWNNQCRKTQRLLALAAGNDLPESETAGMQRHLVDCRRCREARDGLQHSQHALEGLRLATVEDAQAIWSVWPGIARQIRSQLCVSAAPSWHKRLPNGTLAAACVAMIAIVLASGMPSSDGQLSAGSVPVSPRHVRSISRNQPQSFPGYYPYLVQVPADPDNYRNF